MCGKLSVTNFSVELVLARNVRFNFWTGVAGCYRVGFQSALNRKTVGDNRSSAPLKAFDQLGESPNQGNVTTLNPTW